MKKQRFKFLGDILNKKNGNTGFVSTTSKSNFNADAFDFFSLLNHWEEVVGTSLAQNARPLRIQHQTLIIITRHSAYAQQLSLLEDAVKKKIFTHYPILRSHIQKLRFQNSETFFKKWDQEKDRDQKIKEQNLTKRHQYDPNFQKKKESAERFFQDVQDPELKEILVSLKLQQDD